MGRSAMAPGGIQLRGARRREYGGARAYGTPEQKERWLRPLLAGEIRFVFRDDRARVASSDATNIEASIVRNGNEYVINGRKWWSSGAGDPRCKIRSSWENRSLGRAAQTASMVLCRDAPGVKIAGC